MASLGKDQDDRQRHGSTGTCNLLFRWSSVPRRCFSDDGLASMWGGWHGCKRTLSTICAATLASPAALAARSMLLVSVAQVAMLLPCKRSVLYVFYQRRTCPTLSGAGGQAGFLRNGRGAWTAISSRAVFVGGTPRDTDGGWPTRGANSNWPRRLQQQAQRCRNATVVVDDEGARVAPISRAMSKSRGQSERGHWGLGRLMGGGVTQ